MQKIGFILFRTIVFLVGITPFWVLYGIADFLFVMLYYLIGYRKKVVTQNIRIAFPDISDKEVSSIRRKFFRQMADLLVEALKGPSMSEQDLKKRYKLVDTELIDSFFDKDQNVMGVTGHYANWEWGGMAMPLQQKHIPVGLYKPITNKGVDKFLRDARTKRGSAAWSIYKTKAAFETDFGRPAVYGLVADQSPTNTRKAFCMNFFGRPTPFLHGPEFYSKMYDLPVFYMHIRRVKRGFYELKYDLLVENPQEATEGEITRKYTSYLEETIRDSPYQWLWSHKRWKRDCYKAPKK